MLVAQASGLSFRASRPKHRAWPARLAQHFQELFTTVWPGKSGATPDLTGVTPVLPQSSHELCRFPFRRTALVVAGGGRAGFAGAAAPARRARAPRTTGADGVAAFRRGTDRVAQSGAAEFQKLFAAGGGRAGRTRAGPTAMGQC